MAPTTKKTTQKPASAAKKTPVAAKATPVAKGTKKPAGKNSKLSKRKKIIVKEKDPRIIARPRNFGIGQDIQPKRDLSRFLKWPIYVRLQRQRSILKRRLKVPPTIHQFSRVLNKNVAMRLFRLLHALRPETKQAKKLRRKQMAEESMKVDTPKRCEVKFGLNHVVSLIESKEAQLVVIAHDVDPIELVVYLPALCRRMGVPYVIVRSKSRLGTVIHQKKTTVLAITAVRPGQEAELKMLQDVGKKNYLDKTDEIRKTWGGGKLSTKAKQKVAKKLKEAGGSAALELKMSLE